MDISEYRYFDNNFDEVKIIYSKFMQIFGKTPKNDKNK